MPPKKTAPKKKPVLNNNLILTSQDFLFEAAPVPEAESVFHDAVSSVPSDYQIHDPAPHLPASQQRKEHQKPSQIADLNIYRSKQSDFVSSKEQILSPQTIVIQKALAAEPIVAKTESSPGQFYHDAGIKASYDEEAAAEPEEIAVQLKIEMPKTKALSKKSTKQPVKPVKKQIVQSVYQPKKRNIDSISQLTSNRMLVQSPQKQESKPIADSFEFQDHKNTVQQHSAVPKQINQGFEDEKLLELQRWPHSFIEKKISKQELMSPQSKIELLETLNTAVAPQQSAAADEAMIVEQLLLTQSTPVKKSQKTSSIKKPVTKSLVAKTSIKAVEVNTEVQQPKLVPPFQIEARKQETVLVTPAESIPKQPIQLVSAIPTQQNKPDSAVANQQNSKHVGKQQQISTSENPNAVVVDKHQPPLVEESIQALELQLSVPSKPKKKGGEKPTVPKKKVNKQIVLVEEKYSELGTQEESRPLAGTLIPQQINQKLPQATQQTPSIHNEVEIKQERLQKIVTQNNTVDQEAEKKLQNPQTSDNLPSKLEMQLKKQQTTAVPTAPNPIDEQIVESLALDLGRVEIKNKKGAKKQTKIKPSKAAPKISLNFESLISSETVPQKNTVPPSASGLPRDDSNSINNQQGTLFAVPKTIQTKAPETINSRQVSSPAAPVALKEEILSRLVRGVELKSFEDERRQIMRQTICMLRQDILSRKIERPTYGRHLEPEPHLNGFLEENARLKRELRSKRNAS